MTSALIGEEVVALIRLFLIGVALLIVVLVLAAFVAWRAIRRASRRIGGWGWRLLELRSNFLPAGPRRNAARLRCRLDAELCATRDMLQRAPQGVVFRADAAALLRELAATATELDAQLAAVERFLDPAQQQKALATVSGQVEELIETTYEARQTILRTAAEDRIRQLGALRDNVALQASALDIYQRDRRQASL